MFTELDNLSGMSVGNHTNNIRVCNTPSPTYGPMQDPLAITPQSFAHYAYVHMPASRASRVQELQLGYYIVASATCPDGFHGSCLRHLSSTRGESMMRDSQQDLHQLKKRGLMIMDIE